MELKDQQDKDIKDFKNEWDTYLDEEERKAYDTIRKKKSEDLKNLDLKREEI